MATSFLKALEGMAPERQERIRKRIEELLAELPIQEVRQARALSQQELARTLGYPGSHGRERRGLTSEESFQPA